MRIISARFDSSFSVIVVISVRPIVAVRPGSAPMTRPTSVDVATQNSDSGVMNDAIDWPKATRPSNISVPKGRPEGLIRPHWGQRTK